MGKKQNKAKNHDDALQSYFDQIKNNPLLSFEEEQELSKRIQAGDEEARKILVERNLRLVVKIARNYQTPDVAFLDLVQEGNIGLMKAAEKFDYRKKVRFSTYASWWIKQSITRSLSNKRRSIRLPHRKEDTLKKIQKTFMALNQKLMRKPSIEEVARELKIEKQEVLEILNISGTVVSLDTEINTDAGTLHDVYEDNSYSPEREFMKKSMRDQTMVFLERLREKEKKILLYRFAFHGGKRYTLKRISDELGISPETVRQIEMRALKKLREQAVDLQDYVLH